MQFVLYFVVKDVLIRVLNVVMVIAYVLDLLIGGIALVYSFVDKPAISADVKCPDGTTWNAFDDGYQRNNYALCGLCTKRTVDNQRFDECNYKDYNVNSYKIVNQKYEVVNKETLYVGLGVIFGGLLLIDFINISLYYILSGKLNLGRSLYILAFSLK